jgi:hypothetical protein
MLQVDVECKVGWDGIAILSLMVRSDGMYYSQRLLGWASVEEVKRRP